MREKKVRGMKRKTQQIIKEMNANTQSFPAKVSDYWHLPLPMGFICCAKYANHRF